MYRTIVAAALTGAALLTAATPAAAGGLRPRSDMPPSGRWPAAAQPIHVHGHDVLPCVTTSWRSAQWRKPLTRVGATCYATPDMWVSRYWPRVGTVRAPSGRALPVYLRTV